MHFCIISIHSFWIIISSIREFIKSTLSDFIFIKRIVTWRELCHRQIHPAQKRIGARHIDKAHNIYI